MRIDELNEFQGVTPQLVTDWLLANGWTQTKPGWWERGEDGFLFDSQTFDQQWFWVHALVAVYECCGVQEILRMINPRMRKGVPSKEARAAAKSYWLASWGEGSRRAANLWDSDLMEHFADSPELVNWSFWPCDEHGNKVRWPTDAQGNML